MRGTDRESKIETVENKELTSTPPRQITRLRIKKQPKEVILFQSKQKVKTRDDQGISHFNESGSLHDGIKNYQKKCKV